eukprot:8679299-Prorocentrum_lima.AAC.1
MCIRDSIKTALFPGQWLQQDVVPGRIMSVSCQHHDFPVDIINIHLEHGYDDGSTRLSVAQDLCGH